MKSYVGPERRERRGNRRRFKILPIHFGIALMLVWTVFITLAAKAYVAHETSDFLWWYVTGAVGGVVWVLGLTFLAW